MTGVPASSHSASAVVFAKTLDAPAATIDTGAGAIPAGKAALYVVAYARGGTAGGSTGLLLRLNADAGANYDELENYLDGGAAGTWTENVYIGAANFHCYIPAAASDLTSSFGMASYLIPAYDQTVGWKSVMTDWGKIGSTITPGYMDRGVNYGVWHSTAAITRVSITCGGGGNFIAGSSLTVLAW